MKKLIMLVSLIILSVTGCGSEADNTFCDALYATCGESIECRRFDACLKSNGTSQQSLDKCTAIDEDGAAIWLQNTCEHCVDDSCHRGMYACTGSTVSISGYMDGLVCESMQHISR